MRPLTVTRLAKSCEQSTHVNSCQHIVALPPSSTRLTRLSRLSQRARTRAAWNGGVSRYVALKLLAQTKWQHRIAVVHK